MSSLTNNCDGTENNGMLMIVMVVMMIIMIGKYGVGCEDSVIGDKLFCKVNGRWFCSCRWG